MIKIEKLAEEVKEVRRIIAKHNRMEEDTIKELENKGYEYTELGTGRANSYICSKEVILVDCRKNRKFCTKKNLLLAVGIASKQYGRGVIYRAYTKEIEGTANLTKEEAMKFM